MYEILFIFLPYVINSRKDNTYFIENHTVCYENNNYFSIITTIFRNSRNSAIFQARLISYGILEYFYSILPLFILKTKFYIFSKFAYFLTEKRDFASIFSKTTQFFNTNIRKNIIFLTIFSNNSLNLHRKQKLK